MKYSLAWITLSLLCGMAQASVKFNLLGAESHGGNPNMRSLFREAKLQAAAILEQINPQEIQIGRNPRVVDIVLKKRFDWAVDVLNSDHHWPADDKEEQDNLNKLPAHLRDRSAVTSLAARARIVFSYTVAEKRANSLERAVQVLLHESLHHLNFEDEDEIDRLVDIVTSYWESKRSPDEKLGSAIGGLPSDIFSHGALKLCAAMAFSKDKVECLRTSRFAIYDDKALELCGSLEDGPTQNSCLAAIKNRMFDAGSVSICASQSLVPERLACLKLYGVETESLHGMGEGFEVTPWFVLSARNFDLLTDATSWVRAQAKGICDGWKQFEYSGPEWEKNECVRTKRPIGAKTRTATVPETPNFYYHCNVRTRCTMKQP